MSLVKGDTVEFERADNGHVLRLPKNYVILHDVTGKHLRTCNFYIVPFVFRKATPGHKPDSRLLKEAVEYYGKNTELDFGTIDLPKGRWVHLCDVSAIRYWREGEYAVKDGEDGYRHEYKINGRPAPQPLFYLAAKKAYYVRHPDGCIANARGIVAP